MNTLNTSTGHSEQGSLDAMSNPSDWGSDDLRHPGRLALQRWEVRELLGSDLPSAIQGVIRIDERVFEPNDPWANTFREGLRLAGLSGVGIEVGMGAGANIVDLLARNPLIKKIYGSDFVPEVSRIGADNIAGIGGIDADRFELIPGKIDLMTDIQPFLDTPKLQFVVGCIPQVRLPEEGSPLPNRDAHYYNGDIPKGYEAWDHYDLTLNARLLAQATQFLNPNEGTVTLNLAGRVPKKVLEDMFRQTGYEPTTIHEATITQDKDTCLAHLIKSQKEHGITFEFSRTACFTTPPICASKAQKIIDDDGKVYHRLYVMQGLYVGN